VARRLIRFIFRSARARRIWLASSSMGILHGETIRGASRNPGAPHRSAAQARPGFDRAHVRISAWQAAT